MDATSRHSAVARDVMRNLLFGIFLALVFVFSENSFAQCGPGG
jgi:hypothetical protein